MIAVVTGGAASGKSAFAEKLAMALPGPHAYVATMRHGDAETEARIARHLRMREGKGFETIELADDSPAEGGTCSTRANRSALLEDLGNLVANGLQGKLDEVLAFENVVIVANEVGGDGVCYDDFTMNYIRDIGALACSLAARADVVVEVVAGVPNVVKGELPCGC